MKAGFDLLKYNQAFWVQWHGTTVLLARIWVNERNLLMEERQDL